MNKVLVAALVAAGGVCVPALADNIGTIQGYGSGTAVTLDSTAVVTYIGCIGGGYMVDGYTYNNWAIFAQDSTGGIDLFGKLPGSYVPAVGDTVNASGTYSPFDSIPELGTLTALSQTGTAAVPAPKVVTLAQIQSSLSSDTPPYQMLGYVVQLNAVKFQGASGNFPTHANGTYTITDAAGNNATTLFQWASSYSTCGALGGTAVPTGLVNIVGIVDLFHGTPEFIPFSITNVPGPGTAGLFGLGALAAARRRRA